jgi:primosomal protein N''
MNPARLPLWDRTQLALLRLLTLLLELMDRLFSVRWGEHLLERMGNHWQVQLERLNSDLARLERERDWLQSQMEALAIHVATIYLAERELAQDELRFDPAIPRDEEILDASIDLLVKQCLATIETEEIESGHFIYHLELDWAAIRSRLSTAAAQAEPEIAEWFREGARFIDAAFVATGAGQSQQFPTNEHLE